MQRIRTFTAVVVAVAALQFASTSSAPAQIKDGDVIVSAFFDLNQAFNQGVIMYFDPMNPTVLSTLTTEVVASSFHNWIGMAPNNADVVVSEVPNSFATSRLLQINPGGIAQTIAPLVQGSVEGFELDGDNQYIAIAGLGSGSTLLSIDASNGTIQTLHLANGANDLYNEVAIMREGGVTYAVANFTLSSMTLPKLLNLDRTGVQSTLLASAGNPLEQISAIDLDPRTGDLIVTDFDGPSQTEPNGTEVSRFRLGGMITTLTAFVGANAVKVAQDETAYVAGFTVQGATFNNSVLRYDLKTNTVITIFQVSALSGANWSLSGVEIYGSHPLTVNGTGGPSATISVSLNSQDRFAPNASYQIACSFARRPGLTLPNGERLHLNVTDNLFSLTAQNLAPTIFRNFGGRLNALGSAAASIVLPASFPSGLGISVFCAGVVYNTGGVIEVTNTHWFGL